MRSVASGRRLAVLSGHIGAALARATPVVAAATSSSQGVPGKTVFNSLEVVKAFATDPDWAGKPFWMMNLLRFRDNGAGSKDYEDYAKAMQSEVLPQIGGREVMRGDCRTVIGKSDYHKVYIVEYPSPQAFMQMVTSGLQTSKNASRLRGLEEQYLIPIQPGWFHINRPAPAPSRTVTHFTMDNAWATPGGLVGSFIPSARSGETSSTQVQVEAWVADRRFGDNDVIWNLNLLHFKPDGGQESYRQYAKAMGSKAGTLSLFGARSVLASKCFQSLIGEVSFDEAILVEYPCRDSYLSMSASPEYMRTAHFRHEGLQDTYIVSILPDFVDTAPPSTPRAA